MLHIRDVQRVIDQPNDKFIDFPWNLTNSNVSYLACKSAKKSHFVPRNKTEQKKTAALKKRNYEKPVVKAKSKLRPLPIDSQSRSIQTTRRITRETRTQFEESFGGSSGSGSSSADNCIARTTIRLCRLYLAANLFDRSKNDRCRRIEREQTLRIFGSRT